MYGTQATGGSSAPNSEVQFVTGKNIYHHKTKQVLVRRTYSRSHLRRLCLRCSLVSVVSAPISLGREQMMLDVRSSRLKVFMPQRSAGMSLNRLQLRSRSVRLVRNVKFCGRVPRTFFEALRVSRSWSEKDWQEKQAGSEVNLHSLQCKDQCRRVVQHMSTERSIPMQTGYSITIVTGPTPPPS